MPLFVEPMAGDQAWQGPVAAHASGTFIVYMQLYRGKWYLDGDVAVPFMPKGLESARVNGLSDPLVRIVMAQIKKCVAAANLRGRVPVRLATTLPPSRGKLAHQSSAPVHAYTVESGASRAAAVGAFVHRCRIFAPQEARQLFIPFRRATARPPPANGCTRGPRWSLRADVGAAGGIATRSSAAPRAGVDGSVLRIDTAYNDAGLPYLFTSFADTAGTIIVNQVMDIYNGLGQVIKEYQAVNGASWTPAQRHSYNMTILNPSIGSRLIGMVHPNGRTIDHHYGDTDFGAGAVLMTNANTYLAVQTAKAPASAGDASSLFFSLGSVVWNVDLSSSFNANGLFTQGTAAHAVSGPFAMTVPAGPTSISLPTNQAAADDLLAGQVWP